MGRGQTHKQTNRHTDGHRDYLTESAQWADSVKKKIIASQYLLSQSRYMLLQGTYIRAEDGPN